MNAPETCPNCKAPRVANTRFCGNCGAILMAAHVTPGPVHITQPAPRQTPTGGTNPGTPAPVAAAASTEPSTEPDWRKETMVGRITPGNVAPGAAPTRARTPRANAAASGVSPTPSLRPEEAATLEVATREFAPDTVIDGRYRVLNVLGGGGMGAVYRVRHERMHKVMALKVLRSQLSRDPSVRARFHREAQALSHLESRHTVAVFDFGETPDGLLYLAMEHLKGRTLAAALQEGPMGPPRAVHILAQVLKSLEEAHGKGIVHRDIKPDNIFLLDGDERDLVKLIDFGIAKADPPQATRTGPNGGPLTQEDLLVGTPEYMAPEQARGQPVDPRTDVWAVGVVLCECLTGRRPFLGETPIDVIMSILQDPLGGPTAYKQDLVVPAALWRVVEKALAKDAGDRFPSVRAMREAMEAALKEEGIPRLPAIKTNPGQAVPLVLDDDDDEVAGRDEWARFTRAQRRRRFFLGTVMAGALAGGATWLAPQLLADPHVTEEREPNNGATEANLVAQDSSITGVLSTPVQGKADSDFFVLQLPEGPQVLELDVEQRGGPEARLGLTVWQDEKALLQGFGQREPRHRVRHLVVEGRAVYVRVREENVTSDIPPTPADLPYRLTLRPLRAPQAKEEREPNNRPDQANVLAKGTPLTADLTPSDDEDTYRLHLDAADADDAVDVVPSPGLELEVAMVNSQGRHLGNKKSRDGEKLTLPVKTSRCGSPCHITVMSAQPVPEGSSYTITWK